jgi:plastocyanin
MTKPAALVLAACCSLAGTARAAEVFVTVSTTSPSYSPAVVFIQPGDTVTWTYAGGPMPHQVRADDDSYMNPVSSAPWTFSHVFPTAMTSRYYCGPHGGPGGGGMSGVVVVGSRAAWSPTDIPYTLNAWDFTSRTSVTNTGSAGIPYHRTSTSGIERWIAGVRLPSGAAITGLEMSACDASGSTSVMLSECIDPSGACTVLGTVMAPAIPTCGFFSVPVSGVNVDNLGKSYVVEAEVTAGAGSLRAVRVFHRKSVSPAPATARFGDMPTTDPRFRFVEALAAAGITGGCGPGAYCPEAAVTRGQMAVFLAVALGLYWPN